MGEGAARDPLSRRAGRSRSTGLRPAKPALRVSARPRSGTCSVRIAGTPRYQSGVSTAVHALFAEVLTKVLVVDEHFDEYLRPPQPPERLTNRTVSCQTADPDYPPSTCCVG